MSEKYDVIIVGAGLVGMTMALALARIGIKIALLEKTSMQTQFEPEFDGRVSAIAIGSKHILDNIGAWELIQPYAEPIFDIRVTDGETPFFLHYDHNEIGNEAFGYIVENRHIRNGLYKASAPLKNITFIDNFKVDSLSQDSCSVTISGNNGKILNANLLIAADGRISQVRTLAGIGVRTLNYNQTAIVCTIKHELPHHGLAQEKFFSIGPFAVLPMQNNCSSLVWVEPNDRAAIYLELPEEEFIQEISERIGGYLGEITNTIGKRFSYPLSLLHAKKYTSGRVVAIGDAAHGIHPIAGQGVNLGFRDVETLAEILKNQHYLGLDIGSGIILQNYAQLRYFDNVSMIAITDFLNRLFSNNILPFRIARDLGLWTVGKLPSLKKIFMLHAMGTKNI